jgi:hypothetical protein
VIHNSGKEEPKEGRQGHQKEIPAAALNRMMVMVTMPSLSLSFHAGRVTFRALVCGDEVYVCFGCLTLYVFYLFTQEECILLSLIQ